MVNYVVKWYIYILNKKEKRLEKTRICEKETDLFFTMTMEHKVAYGGDKRRAL